MRSNHKAAPALAVAAMVMLASGAAGARTTADEVVDDATLKAFVEGAAAEIAAITDVAVGGRLRDRFRTDPDWNSGSMFLILFTQSGNPFIHGNDRAAENRDLLGIEDDNGFRVVEALLAAGARGGDFVRYHDGEPKTAYAVEYTSGISGRRFGAGRRLLAGHLPCPAPYRGSAQTRRHRIAGRRPRDPRCLRRGSGQGIQRAGPQY